LTSATSPQSLVSGNISQLKEARIKIPLLEEASPSAFNADAIESVTKCKSQVSLISIIFSYVHKIVYYASLLAIVLIFTFTAVSFFKDIGSINMNTVEKIAVSILILAVATLHMYIAKILQDVAACGVNESTLSTSDGSKKAVDDTFICIFKIFIIGVMISAVFAFTHTSFSVSSEWMKLGVITYGIADIIFILCMWGTCFLALMVYMNLHSAIIGSEADGCLTDIFIGDMQSKNIKNMSHQSLLLQPFLTRDRSPAHKSFATPKKGPSIPQHLHQQSESGAELIKQHVINSKKKSTFATGHNSKQPLSASTKQEGDESQNKDKHRVHECSCVVCTKCKEVASKPWGKSLLR